MERRRILLVGATSQIAAPVIARLAPRNDVWGVARFHDESDRQFIESLGVTAVAMDLADPHFEHLPRHIDHVAFFATLRDSAASDDERLRVDAEGTGLVMARFANARSCLVVSSTNVYAEADDPAQALKENSPLGLARGAASLAKIAQEAVARACARMFGLPTTIARLNVPYGASGGLPAQQLDLLVAREAVPLAERGPTWFNPIDERDVADQVPRLLEVASVPARVVNWSGDDPVRSEEYVTYLGEMVGVTPVFRYTAAGICSRPIDTSRRRQLIGTCRVHWRDGMRHMAGLRYPDLVDAPGAMS